MRFSAPVKKHWLGSFSIVLPPSGLRGFVPVVRDRPCSRESRGPGRGGGGAYHGGAGGGGGGTESIYTSSDDPMLDAQTSGTWPSAHACLCRCMASFYLRHRQLRCVIIGTLAASATTPIAGQLLLHPGSHPQHNRR